MVRYGIIGLGMMGHEHLRNIALLDGAVIGALSDPNADMRDSALALTNTLFGSQPPCFEDHRELIASGLCDVFVVVSPNHTHHAIMADLMICGLPVLCEKPIGISQDECADMLDWQKESGTTVWVAMEYRYMPPVQRLLDDVNGGRIGKIVQVSIREHRFPFLEKVGAWNRFNANTGGTLVEKCCHFFDLMRLITQSNPVRLFASGGVDVNHLDERYGSQTPDIVDNAFVIVDFENGTRAMLDLCMFDEASNWQEIVSASGPMGTISACIPGPSRFSVDGKERTAEIHFSDRATKTETHELIEVDHAILAAGDHHGSTFYQHQRFQKMVMEGGEPEVSLRDGAIAVIVGAAAEESIQTGVAIDLRHRIRELSDPHK